MLVLSRKTDQRIVIGTDIHVTVLEVRGDVVKLGISAPRHISVHRQEVFDEIERSNQQAVSPLQPLIVQKTFHKPSPSVILKT